jgi:hypothetical protein
VRDTRGCAMHAAKRERCLSSCLEKMQSNDPVLLDDRGGRPTTHRGVELKHNYEHIVLSRRHVSSF